MKILLLELSGSDSLARKPGRYSGCGPTFRRLAENIDNCYLAGLEECFEGDITNKCLPLNKFHISQILSYAQLEEVIRYRYHVSDDPEPPPFDFDLIVYSKPDVTLNTTKPQLCWSVGAYEKINPNIKHLLLHNPKWQQPIIQNPDTKVHEFVLGIEIPPFEERTKKNQILQITNHYPQINSIILAQWALKYEIKTIFAGPISEGYPLLDYIDYHTTWYLGQIKEEEKIKLMKESLVHASLYSHPINGPNLSTKTALSYGCWILTTNAGIMPEVIQNRVNGHIINNEGDFLDAWGRRDQPKQANCWNTAQNWSLDKMINSFKKVVNEILSPS